MDPGDREMLIYWIRVQKRAERDAKDAKEQGAIWFRRAKLAQSRGEEELARRAQEQALAARDRWQRAMAEFEKAQMERDVLSRTSRAGSADQGTLERAEAAQQQFRDLGIQPEDDAFARLEAEARSEEARRRLRDALAQESEAPTAAAEAPADDTSMTGAATPADDALARLKRRMAGESED